MKHNILFKNHNKNKPIAYILCVLAVVFVMRPALAQNDQESTPVFDPLSIIKETLTREPPSPQSRVVTPPSSPSSPSSPNVPDISVPEPITKKDHMQIRDNPKTLNKDGETSVMFMHSDTETKEKDVIRQIDPPAKIKVPERLYDVR